MTPNPYFLTWNKQTGVPVLEVRGAEHDEFVLADNRRVFDFISTSFQASFGHSNERITKRIAQQLESMPIASPKASFELKEGVTRSLLDLLGYAANSDRTGRIFYTVSGAEAVENALKISRHFSKRKKILARRNSYHGATLGAMSVSGDWRSQDHLTFADGTVRIPEPGQDPDTSQTRQVIEAAGPSDIAAIIVETISGVNGVVIPPDSWWVGIRDLCTEFDILFIADEVLCGFGRTGPAFAFQQFPVKPDIVCMSKAITGGYFPFGAAWVSSHIAERYDEDILACGLTNYAHPGGLAALDVVMELLQNQSFVDNKSELESVFKKRLDELSHSDRVGEIRCQGLLAAVDLLDEAPPWTDFLNGGNYLFSKGNSIVLAPPLVSTPERLNRAFDELTAVIS